MVKGALGIEKPMSEWADEGIASVEAGGVGFETYRINLPHTDGTNEISYRFQENQVKVKEKGYIPFGQDGVFQNIITTNQTFQILLNTGAVTKSIHDFKGEINLFGKTQMERRSLSRWRIWEGTYNRGKHWESDHSQSPEVHG